MLFFLSFPAARWHIETLMKMNRVFCLSHSARCTIVKAVPLLEGGCHRSQILRFSSSSSDSSFHSNVDSAIGASKDENIQRYKADKLTAAKWLDIGVVKRKGRVYDADTSLIPAEQAITFPSIQCTTMDGANQSIPTELSPDHKVKLVVFSFKHYGFTLVRSWLDPFIQKFPSTEISKNKIGAVEICFIEYGFLAMAKTIFINSIKNNIADSQFKYTYLTFGNVMEFATQLSLPNVYTGYAYLLDEQNRIRWHACGEAKEAEVQGMLKCAQELINESSHDNNNNQNQNSGNNSKQRGGKYAHRR